MEGGVYGVGQKGKEGRKEGGKRRKSKVKVDGGGGCCGVYISNHPP